MTSPHDHDPSDSSPPSGEDGGDAPLRSGLGSGLLAQQPTPSAEQAVAVAKVCPQCGGEYETGDRFCPKDGTPLRPKSGGDPLVGRVIAERYLVLARLGEGGMGRVYLAEHVKMNRQCAVKVMNPSLVTDSESLQRFAREASSAARILHPNVAAVFDYGEADKIVYLVMEYVDGESLSELLARDGALDPRRGIELARQIADGLHAAHELGIVHRDLKPDNVIVTRNKSGKEIPKIVDFGIAKAISESQQDALTRSGLVIGTPEYMSPEQLLGDPVDARADIYSLGCIFYQMLTGEAAFAAESREQMIRRRLHEPPPHIRDVMPSLPRRLDTLIAHMLARSPADRLASAAEARDALDPALALGGWDPSMVSAPRPHADPTLQPTMPMPKVRTSPKRIALGASVGAVVLLGGLWAWTARPTPAAPVRSIAAPKDTVTELAPTGAESLAKAVVAKPAVDSAKPKPPAAPSAEFTAPLAPFIAALQSGNVDNVGRAIPNFGPDQRKSFETFFSNAEHIAIVRKTYGTPAINGDAAELGLVLMLKYKSRGSDTRSTLNYRANYKRMGDKWQLVGLVSR
jgi:eukaryotic-like serine/threonine-protein kinase